MNLKPEQIPDEVVEAAEAAILEQYPSPDVSPQDRLRRGSAAALPVLLKPVTFKYRRLGAVDPNEWYPCSRQLYDAFLAGTTKSKDLEFVPLTYTLPTQDTPNEQ